MIPVIVCHAKTDSERLCRCCNLLWRYLKCRASDSDIPAQCISRVGRRLLVLRLVWSARVVLAVILKVIEQLAVELETGGLAGLVLELLSWPVRFRLGFTYYCVGFDFPGFCHSFHLSSNMISHAVDSTFATKNLHDTLSSRTFFSVVVSDKVSECVLSVQVI